MTVHAHISPEAASLTTRLHLALSGDLAGALSPDEARALALELWDAADRVEGLQVSTTEPSPG